MGRPFGLYYLIAFFSFVAIALLFFFRDKLGLVTLLDKNEVTIVKDIVTTIAIVLGGIAAYFKFFSGRTFSLKAEIDVTCDVIKTPSSHFLHLVKISFKNVGNLVVKSPTASVSYTAYHKDPELNLKGTLEHITELTLPRKKEDSFPSSALQGETIFFEFEKEFTQEIWAVKYVVEVRSKNTNWTNFKIISNSNKIEVNQPQ